MNTVITSVPSLPPHRADLTGHTVVFLHAHPDDEAIFTAVAMRRLADRGARVVLVTATGGEEGKSLVALPAGGGLDQRRLRELRVACRELAVARLVLLGYRDSGMSGTVANAHRRAFARQDCARAGRQLADLLVEERAEALVHYDAHGIYGHPDHVAVHRLGRWAARRAGVTAYEATVDREQLRTGPRHLVEGDRPRDDGAPLGRGMHEVTTRLLASPAELVAKRRAMAAHASQIPAEVVTGQDFASTYQLEWYVRIGLPRALDEFADHVAPYAQVQPIGA